MVKITFTKNFLKKLIKIKDKTFREKVDKQIEKISYNPKTGKPMKNERKGTRELYLRPYRIAYSYLQNEEKIIFLDIYHKDKQ